MHSATQDHAAAVAAFLTKRGPTRCPTVCLARTQASAPLADWQALRQYDDEQEARRQRKKRVHHDVIRGKPYVPDAELVLVARKLGPENTEDDIRRASAATFQIMQENIEKGASFEAASETLNACEIPTVKGQKWNSNTTGHFWRRKRKAK